MIVILPSNVLHAITISLHMPVFVMTGRNQHLLFCLMYVWCFAHDIRVCYDYHKVPNTYEKCIPSISFKSSDAFWIGKGILKYIYIFVMIYLVIYKYFVIRLTIIYSIFNMEISWFMWCNSFKHFFSCHGIDIWIYAKKEKAHFQKLANDIEQWQCLMTWWIYEEGILVIIAISSFMHTYKNYIFALMLVPFRLILSWNDFTECKNNNIYKHVTIGYVQVWKWDPDIFYRKTLDKSTTQHF